MKFFMLLKRLFKFKIIPLKRCMKIHGIRIRLHRLLDLPDLYSFFCSSNFREIFNIEHSPFHSFWSFKRWINTTFDLLYIIELRNKKVFRTIGFIGLYKLKIDESLWISEALFDAKDRGRRYGQYALKLLLDILKEKAIVGEIFAEVHKDNSRSLRLFDRLGFDAYEQHGNTTFLRKSLE